MREICIDDFLMKCNSSLVERHSDSSDFESPRKIPIVASNDGNHTLLNEGTCNTKHETHLFNKHASNTTVRHNTTNRNKVKTAERRTQQKNKSTNNNKVTNEGTKPDHLYKKITLNKSNKNHGDQSTSYYSKNVNSNFFVRNKAVPCLSTIFRRRNNCTKHLSIIEEDQPVKDIAKDFERACCSNCERRRVKRVRRHRRGCSIQPVYNVEENIRGFPFTKNNNKTPSCEFNKIFKNNGTDIINDLNISSKSELENTNPYKHNFFPKNKKNYLGENIHGLPFIANKNKSPLPKHKMSKYNCTDIGNDLTISSNSELEKIKPYKHLFLKKLKKRHEKEKVIDYLNYEPVKDHQQQYPSKFQINPYQIFSTSSCHGKCSVCESESLLKMPSSSSTFWDFFARKMKNKIQKPGVSRSCDCTKPPVNQPTSQECSPESCQKLRSYPENIDYYNTDQRVPNKNSFCQQTDQYSSQSSTASKKKSKEPKVNCKCYSNKKKSNRLKNDTKPCQEEHDEITKAISEKYNGEILCIHNPPCILINGCLNLPPPKMNIQGNLWPVTQSKKSSFVQMCRKIKRSKNKSYEQASQYHPPYIDLQEYLPEFKTEKLIQSICNHDPPCEIVHGCYKVQYDPKLQNSCIHVPMCQYLPACLISNNSKNISTGSCIHHPKCAKLPMCSRKYITLTAKETVGIQVKPKANMTCRHKPPCFMIPKCLAQATSGNYIPYGPIPGCVHQPCCEMIPACCRKSAKEMDSVPSQYPNACRIV